MENKRFFVSKSPSLHAKVHGQTMIYLVAVIAMLMFTGLWLVDFNRGATFKIRGQSATDGSALAAAQWQARSLNAIGEINLIKAIDMLALVKEPPPMNADLKARFNGTSIIPEKYDIIQGGLDSLQERIGFVGPILGFVAAQQAAKNTGIKTNPEYTAEMYRQAETVKRDYARLFYSAGWGNEDWAAQYAQMLYYLADQGVAVAEDNVSYYWMGDLSGANEDEQEWLLNQEFYFAIADEDWCYVAELLFGDPAEDDPPYSSWHFWAPIEARLQVVHGSEFYNLGVHLTASSQTPQLEQSILKNFITEELDRRNLEISANWPPTIQWTTYILGDTRDWGMWDRMFRLQLNGSMVAPTREYYDYRGADARTTVSIPNENLLALNDRGKNWNSWIVGVTDQSYVDLSVKRLKRLPPGIQTTSSAKPFGRLPDVSEPAYQYGLVLPIFNDVRLVPNKSVAGSTRDPEWLRHLMMHIPEYTHSGPVSLDTQCFYCQQLMKWDDDAFRQKINDWLTAIDPQTGELLHDCNSPQFRSRRPSPDPLPDDGVGNGKNKEGGL